MKVKIENGKIACLSEMCTKECPCYNKCLDLDGVEQEILEAIEKVCDIDICDIDVN